MKDLSIYSPDCICRRCDISDPPWRNEAGRNAGPSTQKPRLGDPQGRSKEHQAPENSAIEIATSYGSCNRRHACVLRGDGLLAQSQGNELTRRRSEVSSNTCKTVTPRKSEAAPGSWIRAICL